MSSTIAVTLVNPPASTTANADTALTLSALANYWVIQNTSPNTCYISINTPAFTGSIPLISGEIWEKAPEDLAATSIHIYSTVATPINAANGIIIVAAN